MLAAVVLAAVPTIPTMPPQCCRSTAINSAREQLAKISRGSAEMLLGQLKAAVFPCIESVCEFCDFQVAKRFPNNRLTSSSLLQFAHIGSSVCERNLLDAIRACWMGYWALLISYWSYWMNSSSSIAKQASQSPVSIASKSASSRATLERVQRWTRF